MYRFRRIMPVLVVATLMATACRAGQATPTPARLPTDTAPSGGMKGAISDVQTANAEEQEAGKLGHLRVEGEKIDPNYKRAMVTVTEDSRIYRKDGETLVTVGFESLEVGQMVEVQFVGPILESDPIQVTAGEVLILASMPKQ